MNNLQQGILKQKLQSIKSGWFRNYFLIAMLLLLVSKTQAQFPVQVTPIVLPPYTQQLSEYYSGTNPKIAVTLTNADLNKPLIDVTLRMTISSQNILLKSKNNVPYPTISLSAGVPYTLSQADLAVYFNPDNLEFSGMSQSEYQNYGIIPSGFYTFCFEVIENITALPASNKQCTYAAISRNLPPFLNLPLNNSSIESADPNNIIFNWTPRHLSSPNSLFTTQYKFQLVEFLDNGVSPDVAFRTGQPLYQQIITTTSLLYGPNQPLLQSGKKYGWRVQVINTQGSDTLDMYENDGYSEVYSFTYIDVCHPPSGVTENITPDAHVHVSWSESRIINTNGYILQYKKKNEIKWITLKNNFPEFDLDNLYNGETYEYHCGNNCKANEDTLYDNIHTVTIPERIFSKNSIHGRISWVYKETEEVEDTSSAPFVSKTGLALDTEGDDKAYYEEMKAVYDRQGIDIASVFAGKPVILNLSDKGGKDLHFLKWATVTISNDAGVVAVCKTDANGYFETVMEEQLLRNLLKSTKPLKIKITHSSKLFNFSERVVTSRPNSQITTTVVNGVQVSNQIYNLSTGWDFGEDTLVAQSFELKQMAVIKNYTGAKVTADVLLRQSFFENYPFMINAGLGVNGEVVTYDHADYVKLVTIDNGKAYKKLFLNPEPSENYLVRINYPGRQPVYYPLNAVTQPVKPNGHRDLCIVNKRYPYKLTQGIEGIITAKNIDGVWLPQEGARVEIRINKDDILGRGDTVTSFMAISDKFGNYGSYDIPPLVEDATIQLIVTANSIRSKPFTFTTTLSGDLNTTFDIKLENFVYTAIGRLLNQYQKPIENASITVLDADGIPSFTTKDGFYFLKFYDYDTAKIKIQVDGQEDLIKTITPSNSWNLRNGNQIITASDWSNAIHRTKQVVANSSIFNKLNGNDAQVFLTSNAYNDRALVSIFNEYFSQLELPKGVADLDSTILQQKEYDYNLIVNYKDKNGGLHEKIIAGLEIINSKDGEKVFDGKTNDGEIFKTKLVAGNYTILLKGLTDDPALVPYKNDFEISASVLGTDDSRTDSVNMSEGVILTGKVTSFKYFDTANNWKVKKPITEEVTVNGIKTIVPKTVDSVLVALTDLELSTYSDKDGNYKFVVPIKDSLAFSVSKDGYNQLDTVFSCNTNKAVDFQLELRDGNLPSIYTIAGFPVIIDKLYKAENLVAADKGKNIFTVSGKMKLTKNDIFNPGEESKNNTLTFTNALVAVEKISDKNAIPTKNIVFNEVILNAKAFGFVPVEIKGVPSIKGDTNHNAIILKSLEGSWGNSVITGSKITARFSNIRKISSYLPFTLEDAELISNENGNEATPIAYIYATPDYKINALSEDKEFGVKFLDSLLTKSDADSGSSIINTAVTATTTAAANALPVSSKCTVSGGTWTAGVNGTPGTCACTLPKVLQADGSCAIPKIVPNATPITEESKCTTSGGTWTAGATPSCKCPTGKVLRDGACISPKDTIKVEPKDSINFRLGVLFSMRFAQDNIKLSKDGVKMDSGVFRLIKPLAIKLNRNIQVEKLVINKDLNIEEIKIDISKGKPLGIKMGRVKTNITSLTIIGIGGNPANYGGGLGGSIELFPKSTPAPTTTSTTPPPPSTTPIAADDTTFISLEVKKVPEGISFKGEVKLDASGLSLGNLIFKTPNSTNGLSFGYDATKKSYEIKASGIIDYGVKGKANEAYLTNAQIAELPASEQAAALQKQKDMPNNCTTSKGTWSATTKTCNCPTGMTLSAGKCVNQNPMIKKAFPIEIETFELTTNNFSLLLVAKSNRKIEFAGGNIKFAISKLLISVGGDKSVNELNDNLVKGTPLQSAVAAGDEEAETEGKESDKNFAIGFNGEVEFGVKGIFAQSKEANDLNRVDSNNYNNQSVQTTTTQQGQNTNQQGQSNNQQSQSTTTTTSYTNVGLTDEQKRADRCKITGGTWTPAKPEVQAAPEIPATQEVPAKPAKAAYTDQNGVSHPAELATPRVPAKPAVPAVAQEAAVAAICGCPTDRVLQPDGSCRIVPVVSVNGFTKYAIRKDKDTVYWPNTAYNTGKGKSYTYSYVGTGTTNYPASPNPPKSLGTYTVTASVKDTIFYAAASSAPMAFEITPPLIPGQKSTAQPINQPTGSGAPTSGTTPAVPSPTNKSGSISASVLIAYIDNELSVKINEIAIAMETPSFSLAGKVKISTGGDREGAEGEVAFNTLSTGFEGGFKFYEIKANPEKGIEAGVEVGLRIVARVGINVSAARLYSIGGGFDLNTSDKTWSVFLEGDIGPRNTTIGLVKGGLAPAPYYFKSAFVKVLFDPKKCDNNPVIEAGASLMKRQEGDKFPDGGGPYYERGRIGLKMDFCRNIYMVTAAYHDTLLNVVMLDVEGVFVGMEQNNKAAVFLGINANVSGFGGIIKGNVNLSLGVNYHANDPNSPPEVNNLYNAVVADVKEENGTYFNGIYIGGFIAGGDEGVLDAEIVDIHWYWGIKAEGYVYACFSNTDWGLHFAVQGKGGAWADTFLGKVSIDGLIEGSVTGKHKSEKWDAEGLYRLMLKICGIGVDVKGGFKYTTDGGLKMN